MKLKEFLKTFYTNIKEGISRFLTAFICTILAFVTISFEIIFETNSDEIIVPLCMSYALVAVLSVLLKSAQEYLFKKLRPVIQYISSGLIGVVAFVLITLNYDSIYTAMAYTGIMIALICFIFYILMRGENRTLAFPRLVSSCIFSGAICGILSGGLSICIAAFELLIFSWDNFYKFYLIVNLFVWAICFVNIFLSFIPKKDVPVPQSKIFRAFVLFAGLPLYILLITILLAYLAKIVITWNMPVGEINWFASFASLFFIFFLLSVMQYKEKLARIYVKFGGYFLIPVLVMQAIAVFERVNAYGLTTPRTISLVLIVISVLFIAGSLAVPKHLNKISLVSGIIVLAVTITPFNVIDMPVASQTNILKSTLMANDMLKDGTVVPNPNVSEADAKRIVSSFKYLIYNAEKTPDFIPDDTKSIEEIFGFTADKYNGEENYYTSYTFETKDSVDITDFDRMVFIDSYDATITLENNGQQFDVDVMEIAQNLYAQYGSDCYDIDLYSVNENLSLYISDLYVYMENDEINQTTLRGYALFKN